ncbi:glucosaminidase [Shewanella sp. OPT22]|nr:glucosaminidase [Shewanella sp. OPT22]
MKSGKIGKFTIAIGAVLVIIYGFRVHFLPTSLSEVEELILAPKNKSQTTSIPDFQKIRDIPTRKKAFFDFLSPAIKEQNALITKERNFLQSVQKVLGSGNILDDGTQFKVTQLAKKYQLSYRRFDSNTIKELLKRVDTVPQSLVLVQAANESGWGSSRFAREGLNFFGQWCYRKGCGLIPSSRTDGLTHEVTVFPSVEASIASYMRNLNSNAAYSLFRSIRYDLRKQGKQPDAAELVYGLVNYSERQEAYIDELLDMLRHNKKYLVQK